MKILITGHLHENLKRRVLFQLPWGLTVGMHYLRSTCFDMPPPNQTMHARAGMKHGVEGNQVAVAVLAALKSNDGDGMARLLKVNRWEERLMDVGAVRRGCLLEIFLNSGE